MQGLESHGNKNEFDENRGIFTEKGHKAENGTAESSGENINGKIQIIKKFVSLGVFKPQMFQNDSEMHGKVRSLSYEESHNSCENPSTSHKGEEEARNGQNMVNHEFLIPNSKPEAGQKVIEEVSKGKTN